MSEDESPGQPSGAAEASEAAEFPPAAPPCRALGMVSRAVAHVAQLDQEHLTQQPAHRCRQRRWLGALLVRPRASRLLLLLMLLLLLLLLLLLRRWRRRWRGGGLRLRLRSVLHLAPFLRRPLRRRLAHARGTARGPRVPRRRARL